MAHIGRGCMAGGSVGLYDISNAPTNFGNTVLSQAALGSDAQGLLGGCHIQRIILTRVTLQMTPFTTSLVMYTRDVDGACRGIMRKGSSLCLSF